MTVTDPEACPVSGPAHSYVLVRGHAAWSHIPPDDGSQVAALNLFRENVFDERTQEICTKCLKMMPSDP